MNLELNFVLSQNYHSQTQIARVVTESWMERNMFCPRCGNPYLKHFKNNRPVADFYCPACDSEYELKSKHDKLGMKIGDGAYSTMIQRITENNNPDLFCMQYQKVSNRIVDLIFIPKYFFTPNIIEKRSPLKDTARRAGWVGCNILIGKIPAQAKIKIIENGELNNIDDIVYQVRKCDAISIKDITARSWLLDILECINSLKSQEFVLSDIYSFEKILSLKHPGNNNIQAKIRQQLQLLRDKGFIAFLGNGRYKKIGEEA